jgi:hypothetical protein
MQEQARQMQRTPKATAGISKRPLYMDAFAGLQPAVNTAQTLNTLAGC